MRVTRFAQSVQLFGSDDRHLRRIPPSEAARLVAASRAQVRAQRGGRVYELQVSGELSFFRGGPPSPPRLTQYMGQRYTRVREIREGETVVGRVVELKRIHRDDQDLFLLAVRDCGGRLVRRRVVYREELCAGAST